MTDKNKIRAEIERLKNIQSSPIALCNDLISFIDSLPEEKVSDDLDEAAKKAATFHSHISGDKFIPNDYWFFRKGAQWQKEQMIDKACEWLETINIDYYQIREGVFSKELVVDFRKAMEKGT